MFCSLQQVVAQTTLTGKVIDAETGGSISAATVLYATAAGEVRTLTNVDGEFLFREADLPGNLTISHISYSAAQTEVDAIGREVLIKLSPAQVLLEEVSVKARRDGRRYVEQAYAKIDKAKIVEFQKAFYRQITTTNDTINEIYEVFGDLQYEANGVVKYRFTNARSGRAPRGFGLNNMFYLAARSTGISNSSNDLLIMGINTLDDYNFYVEDEIRKDDAVLLRIAYEPKEKVGFSGYLYVDTVKAHIINKVAFMPFNNGLRIPGNMVLNSSLFRAETVYGWLSDDLFEVSHFESRLTMEYSINANHMTTAVISTLINYDRLDDKSAKRLKALKLERDDFKEVRKIKYNPAFWRDNPVIKRTPLEEEIIKSFEDNKLMGNYFDK